MKTIERNFKYNKNERNNIKAKPKSLTWLSKSLKWIFNNLIKTLLYPLSSIGSIGNTVKRLW